MEVESMEKSQEWLTRPDILQKRIEAGAVVESTVVIPLKDLLLFDDSLGCTISPI